MEPARDGVGHAAHPWGERLAGREALLVGCIIDVVRELARQVPPPRGQPFFGLDGVDGDLSPLDEFCRRGIFRKYESVLEIGSGFGAAVRWWQAHFACRVVGLEPLASLATAASILSSRAGLAQETRFVAGRLRALPLRSRYFTHVWASESLPDPTAAGACLREAFRVVRPGGHVALQLSGAPADWAERLIAVLDDLGFVEFASSVMERRALPESARLAREQLRRRLQRAGASEAAADLGELYRRRDEERRVVTQVYARRPAA